MKAVLELEMCRGDAGGGGKGQGWGGGGGGGARQKVNVEGLTGSETKVATASACQKNAPTPPPAKFTSQLRRGRDEKAELYISALAAGDRGRSA